MTVLDVKNQIQSKSINNFYIFAGKEWAVMQVYIDKIAGCKNLSTKRVDSITDIFSKLQNKSFFNSSVCYILRDDKDFMQNESLVSRFMQGIDIYDNVVILILTEIDKRTKFYKHCKDSIIEFEPLSNAVLTKYIKKEIDLNDKNCNILIKVCENDYGRILLEIDKIKHYQKSKQAYGADLCFSELLSSGTVYIPPYDAIFDFVKAVLKRDIKLAFDLLQDCIGVEESPLTLISVLYTNFKQVLQVQSCESRDIERSTGLTSWQIRNAKELTGNYRIGELVNAMKFIQSVERSIKTGGIDIDLAVPYILVNIM